MDDLWPLAALRVRSGDLELRYMDDADVHALARLATDGVHAPEAMPFTVPWTRGTPTEVARSVLAYQWGARASVSTERWTLELAVVRAGEVLGTQGLMASDFPVTRTAETGSWLGLRHHGQGIGTRMRLMILHLFFEGFDGLRATTERVRRQRRRRTRSPAGSGTPRTASTCWRARGSPPRAVATCWTVPPGTPGRPSCAPRSPWSGSPPHATQLGI